MLGQDTTDAWDAASIELAQRIFALAKCTCELARASCLVHWELYADTIRAACATAPAL